MTYLKIHLYCVGIAIFFRLIMSVVISNNFHNKLLLKYYTALRDILNDYGILFVLSNKKFYSASTDYSLRLSSLPFVTFFDSFFQPRAYLQALILGPFQVLIEGFALFAGVFQNYISKHEIDKNEINGIENEFMVRIDSIKNCKNEESALNLMAYYLMKDSEAFIRGRLDRSMKEAIAAFFLEHLKEKQEKMKKIA